MLIAMRKQAAGWVAKILFGLLILSFAAWGIGDYLTPEANPVLAEVGEIEVRRDNVDVAERRQLEQMRQLLGARFDVVLSARRCHPRRSAGSADRSGCA